MNAHAGVADCVSDASCMNTAEGFMCLCLVIKIKQHQTHTENRRLYDIVHTVYGAINLDHHSYLLANNYCHMHAGIPCTLSQISVRSS